MFTVKLNVQQGFHHLYFSFNQTAKTLQTGNTSYHKEQERYGGTGTVTLRLLASALYFMSD
jgi:hypothetical protein